MDIRHIFHSKFISVDVQNTSGLRLSEIEILCVVNINKSDLDGAL